MSVTWCNVYARDGGVRMCNALQEDNPKECAHWASLPHNAVSWCATYELWNGHHLRPPVGMRADQTSHEWIPRLVGPYGSIDFEDQLEPRRKTALEIQQEYHSDPDGDLDGYDGA